MEETAMTTAETIAMLQQVFGAKIALSQVAIDPGLYSADHAMRWARIHRRPVMDYFRWLDAIQALPAKLWLVGNHCPHCGVEVIGPAGSFTWGIVHGVGVCGACNMVEFEYYHYPIAGGPALQALAVVGCALALLP